MIATILSSKIALNARPTRQHRIRRPIRRWLAESRPSNASPTFNFSPLRTLANNGFKRRSRARRGAPLPKPSHPNNKQLNSLTAPQIRALVLHRPIRRRRMLQQQPERNTAIHRRTDRTSLHANRYIHSCPPPQSGLHPPNLTPAHAHSSADRSNRTANSARDLEVFSKHAGRKVINADDVMLLARRNEALESILKQELDEMKAAEGRSEPQNQPKKRGRPSGAGAGPGKGKGKAKQ